MEGIKVKMGQETRHFASRLSPSLHSQRLIPIFALPALTLIMCNLYFSITLVSSFLPYLHFPLILYLVFISLIKKRSRNYYVKFILNLIKYSYLSLMK